MRRLPMMLSMIVLIVLSAYIVPASAQSTTPTLLIEIPASDSRLSKFPGITVAGQTVFMGAGVNNGSGSKTTSAQIWTIAEQGTSFSSSESIGNAKGKPDYSTVAVATAADGSIYAVWSSSDEKRIYLRHRNTAGTWEAQRTVLSGDFPVFPQVKVTPSGQIFVAWRDGNLPIYLKTSSDGGATWSSTYNTGKNSYASPPSIAVGANNQVAIGSITTDFEAIVSIWNGTGLTSETLTSTRIADSITVSIDDDGKMYAAWRGISDSGSNSGIFYAERQGSNSWSTVHLSEGTVKGAVNVLVDSEKNVHLGWTSSVSGAMRFYYAVRASGSSSFTTAVTTSTSGVYNSHIALSSSNTLLHAVMEYFPGSNPYMTYARFATSISQMQATPVIASGAETIKGTSSVSVSFQNVSGTPSQVRWNWESEPTDTDTDSSGWQTYSNPISISVPSTLLESTACTSVTLYTQVRDASLAVSQVKSDSVIFDTSVTAAVVLSNPHMRNKSSQFSDLDGALADIGQDSGASDGASSYTRDPLVYVGVSDQNECSNLTDLSLGRTTALMAPAITINENSFANVLPPPGTFQAGSNQVILRVNDSVGNTKNYTRTMIFDTQAPVLDSDSPGSFSASQSTDASILVSLKFVDVNVTDNSYPGRAFWGIWVANSRTAVADPVTDTELIWTPVEAPGSSSSFTIDRWSLATGLKLSQITTGDYTIYVRFLDGAGNPTAGYLTKTARIDTLTFPTTLVPLIRR